MDEMTKLGILIHEKDKKAYKLICINPTITKQNHIIKRIIYIFFPFFCSSLLGFCFWMQLLKVVQLLTKSFTMGGIHCWTVKRGS